MADDTKSCALTAFEIKAAIHQHAYSIGNGEDATEHLERMNYLNKRLRSFSEVEMKNEPETPPAPAPQPEAPKSTW